MTLGTRSLLFGCHQFLIHPVCVAVAWGKLYGWTWDWRLWLCFLVHDWGYWGCETMDGKDGKMHPVVGGRIVGKILGQEWGRFVRWHSRSMVEMDGFGSHPGNVTWLACADKLAQDCYPKWLYMILGRMTGELEEYRKDFGFDSVEEWYPMSREKMASWAWRWRWMSTPPPGHEFHNSVPPHGTATCEI